MKKMNDNIRSALIIILKNDDDDDDDGQTSGWMRIEWKERSTSSTIQ